MKVWYPQTALSGFADAVSLKLDVEIICTIGQPRTDGRTVYLPQIDDPLDSRGFEALCGICLHECAHVYFRTCPQMGAYARGDALKQACFNAVVDVADETRLEFLIPSARRLFLTSNTEAQAKILAAGAIDNGDPVWAILAAGIMFVRLGRCALYHHIVKSKHKHAQEMRAAYWILRKCQNRRSPTGKAPRPNRTGNQWAMLRRAADDLVAMLKAAGFTSTNPPGQPGSSDMGEVGPCGSEPAQTAGAGGKPAPGDTSATYADGQDAASESGTTSGGAGAGAAAAPGRCDQSFNGALYTQIKPGIAGAIERIARAEEGGDENGHVSGRGIGRNIERALIDGRCFVRRNAEGERLNIAVLLDISGSMEDSIGACAAVAQAFADTIAVVADSVSLAEFDDVPTRVENFQNSRTRGGTQTDQALKWAENALAGKGGRRVCVVITDGIPNSVPATQHACQQLRSRGVQIIGIAFQADYTDIANSLPMARVIAAKTAAELAMQLNRVAAEIASS
jgi:hypothetical protein